MKNGYINYVTNIHHPFFKWGDPPSKYPRQFHAFFKPFRLSPCHVKRFYTTDSRTRSYGFGMSSNAKNRNVAQKKGFIGILYIFDLNHFLAPMFDINHGHFWPAIFRLLRFSSCETVPSATFSHASLLWRAALHQTNETNDQLVVETAIPKIR